MTVGASEEDGMLGRDFIEVDASGELWRFPESLVPAAAGDPLTGFGLCNALLHFSKKFFERVGAFQVQIHFALADPENVAVRIGEPGKYGTAVEIDYARIFAPKFFCVGIRSDEGNTISFDRDRLSVLLFFVNGVNVAVEEDRIGRFGANRCHCQNNEKRSGKATHSSS